MGADLDTLLLKLRGYRKAIPGRGEPICPKASGPDWEDGSVPDIWNAQLLEQHTAVVEENTVKTDDLQVLLFIIRKSGMVQYCASVLGMSNQGIVLSNIPVPDCTFACAICSSCRMTTRGISTSGCRQSPWPPLQQALNMTQPSCHLQNSLEHTAGWAGLCRKVSKMSPTWQAFLPK